MAQRNDTPGICSVGRNCHNAYARSGEQLPRCMHGRVQLLCCMHGQGCAIHLAIRLQRRLQSCETQ